MRIMITCLLTLIPSISLAAPITFNFTGEMGGGAVNGSFTYETVQSPTATNVRGLLNNAVYTLSSWNMNSPAVAVPSSVSTMSHARFPNFSTCSKSKT